MYRTICTELWTDPKVYQLTTAGKLVFLYLITNPLSHLSGIYVLPFSMLLHQTGLSDRVSREALDTLSNYGLAYWDSEREVVWVVNMFAYQGQGPKNEQAAANQLQGLHHSPLGERFLEHYPNVQQYLRKPERVKRDPLIPSLRFAILVRDQFRCQYCGVSGQQTVLEVDHVIPVKDGGTTTKDNLKTACLRCNQGKGTDRVSNLEKSCPSVPVPSESSENGSRKRHGKKSQEVFSERFLDFWDFYPNRNNKKLEKAATAGLFQKLSEADQVLCLQAVQHYAGSQRVKEQIGIKDPKRFLKDEYWREWVEAEQVQEKPSLFKEQVQTLVKGGR